MTKREWDREERQEAWLANHYANWNATLILGPPVFGLLLLISLISNGVFGNVSDWWIMRIGW